MKTEKKVSAEKTPKASKGSEVIGTNKPNSKASIDAATKKTKSDPFMQVTEDQYPTDHATLANVTNHSLSLSMETSMLRELTKGLLSTLISTQKK